MSFAVLFGRLDRMRAVTIGLFAFLELLAPQAGVAQDAGQEPGKLWTKYPLDPTAVPTTAQRVATATAAASAQADSRRLVAARKPAATRRRRSSGWSRSARWEAA